jgi:hypothetical protein
MTLDSQLLNTKFSALEVAAAATMQPKALYTWRDRGFIVSPTGAKHFNLVTAYQAATVNLLSSAGLPLQSVARHVQARMMSRAVRSNLLKTTYSENNPGGMISNLTFEEQFRFFVDCAAPNPSGWLSKEFSNRNTSQPYYWAFDPTHISTGAFVIVYLQGLAANDLIELFGIRDDGSSISFAMTVVNLTASLCAVDECLRNAVRERVSS